MRDDETVRWSWRVGAVVVALSVAGCAARNPPPAPEAPAATRDAEKAAAEASDAALLHENTNLREELEQLRAQLVALEERNAALRAEMDRELQEVLDSKASLRGVHNRALAISRIAEVRVQLDSLSGSTADPEVQLRLSRADELLRRADRALEEGNFGGASYLADRAGELVRNARSVAEFRSRRGASGTIAIVPPRPLEVVARANLREGPGTDRERVAGVEAGSVLLAVGRRGAWYEVKLEAGGTAWIHGSTVR
jgi:hypothetical protein